MLKKSDRIFTNLDGKLPFDIQSSIKRGIWHKYKENLKKSPDAIIEEVKKSDLSTFMTDLISFLEILCFE